MRHRQGVAGRARGRHHPQGVGPGSRGVEAEALRLALAGGRGDLLAGRIQQEQVQVGPAAPVEAGGDGTCR